VRQRAALQYVAQRVAPPVGRQVLRDGQALPVARQVPHRV
jgi:hypothetical protein